MNLVVIVLRPINFREASIESKSRHRRPTVEDDGFISIESSRIAISHPTGDVEENDTQIPFSYVESVDRSGLETFD